mmetsp:Transcript_136/g.472  ORF Transcript_136/g.472 Transcript_136/m.472 type:complete len:211 (+) Transcript_136:801-1433(+)
MKHCRSLRTSQVPSSTKVWLTTTCTSTASPSIILIKRLRSTQATSKPRPAWAARSCSLVVSTWCRETPSLVAPCWRGPRRSSRRPWRAVSTRPSCSPPARRLPLNRKTGPRQCPTTARPRLPMRSGVSRAEARLTSTLRGKSSTCWVRVCGKWETRPQRFRSSTRELRSLPPASRFGPTLRPCIRTLGNSTRLSPTTPRRSPSNPTAPSS